MYTGFRITLIELENTCTHFLSLGIAIQITFQNGCSYYTIRMFLRLSMCVCVCARLHVKLAASRNTVSLGCQAVAFWNAQWFTFCFCLIICSTGFVYLEVHR